MKRISIKTLSWLLIILMLCSTACTSQTPPDETEGDTSIIDVTKGETTSEEDETEAETEADTPSEPVTPPSVSKDLLTFTPASPDGQVLTEKGASSTVLFTSRRKSLPVPMAE